jgi:hypothetical protein
MTTCETPVSEKIQPIMPASLAPADDSIKLAFFSACTFSLVQTKPTDQPFHPKYDH